jgi:tRNA nucleotidyltransferase (CCA-adding enzyme)
MTDFDDLPAPQRRALDLVREVARDKQCRPFLVGGPVRDLLLGRHAIDIDLTLEEGSSTLARALAKRIDGRVRSFPQFLTYKVTAEGLPEIDIATARKERYRKPGALPTVTEGRLKDDLLRRDFAINAIAMDLASGALHDPADGEGDLKDRVIRVLHNESFADDPTRIFRALRLAARLGFTIEPHTAALMRAAIDAGALTHVSRERIWRELFLAMDEREAPRILVSLLEQGALAVIFSNRPLDGALPTLLEEVREQVTADPELDRYVLYTAVLLRGDASPVDLEGSGYSMKRARNLVQIANEVPQISDALAEAQSERQRFRLLKSASPELLSILASRKPEESNAVARFREYQNFKLPLRGNDLEVPGGPHVAKALERTREALFTGEISQEQVRAFAREMAMKYLDREQELTNPSPQGQ